MNRLATRAAFCFTMALILFALAATAALAACAPRDQVVAQLGERFGETRLSLGLDVRGNLVELLASHATGNWSIVATSPEGQSCLIGSGTAWEDAPKGLPKEDPI